MSGQLPTGMPGGPGGIPPMMGIPSNIPGGTGQQTQPKQ